MAQSSRPLPRAALVWIIKTHSTNPVFGIPFLLICFLVWIGKKRSMLFILYLSLSLPSLLISVIWQLLSWWSTSDLQISVLHKCLTNSYIASSRAYFGKQPWFKEAHALARWFNRFALASSFNRFALVLLLRPLRLVYLHINPDRATLNSPYCLSAYIRLLPIVVFLLKLLIHTRMRQS